MRLSLPRKSTRRAEVTAVIPCYNYARYLPDAVRSVLDQDDVDARVIIVDDRSTDDSLEVARTLAEGDSRIRVIAHEVNRGHIQTYNDGFAAVTTEYVTLVSADDLLAPGSLERATSLMERYPRVGMVYGQPIEFSGAHPTALRDGRAPLSWTIWRGHEWIRLACLRGRCFILSPEAVMRTSALVEVGVYNTDLPKSGDLEYWLRTASGWDIGRINGRIQAYYRQHEANMHAITLPSMAHDIQHRVMAFACLARSPIVDAWPRARRYYDIARRAVAREALVLATRELAVGGTPETAEALAAAAIDIRPRLVKSRGVRRIAAQVRRARQGARPTAWQRMREEARIFLDRVRWRIWANTGVS